VDAANVPFKRCGKVVSHSLNQTNQIGVPIGNGSHKFYNGDLSSRLFSGHLFSSECGFCLAGGLCVGGNGLRGYGVRSVWLVSGKKEDTFTLSV
jgi:hypothetical protein